MYQLTPDNQQGKSTCVKRVADNAFIPFDPANVDFQQFKQAINDDTAQLEDADGNLMTAAEAKAFVASLP